MITDWQTIAPRFDELLAVDLTADTLPGFLAAWTRLESEVSETSARLRLATLQDTADAAAEAAYDHFLAHIQPPAKSVFQKLKEKLLASGLTLPGFELPLRRMRSEADLFRAENIPLESAETRLASGYIKIAGAWTVEWDGREQTFPQVRAAYENAPRPEREALWRAVHGRMLADREAINANWVKLLENRAQQAANAGFGVDYRAYRFAALQRFDYTPADCETFHRAIEQVVVPAAARRYEKRRRTLGAAALRPWDLDLETGYNVFHQPPIQPFENASQIEAAAAALFHRVDPVLGAWFETMRREGLLDLPARKGKSPGAFCTSFDVAQRPFIFANLVGLHDHLQTLLHEAGHAFHVFASNPLPYTQQRDAPMEFNEVASMSMELLAAPYFDRAAGGFYADPAEAARARAEHLEGVLLFWPYMAVVDAFQHWVYTHLAAAADPAACDAVWDGLWQRFFPTVDWSGVEASRMTGWHRKRHIHRSPFYYVEYGLAQLGAVQIWKNALTDQAGAVAAYRKALALGGMVSAPELYQAAGARFGFDAGLLAGAVDLIEQTLTSLEG